MWHFKITDLFFCIVLFSWVNLFAQPSGMEVINPEFSKMDTDKDGFVTAGEIQAYQAQRFEELDKDKNGTIDSEEVIADQTRMYYSADADRNAKLTLSESSLQFTEYFKQMDKDNNDKVSEAEYRDYWKGIYHF